MSCFFRWRERKYAADGVLAILNSSADVDGDGRLRTDVSGDGTRNEEIVSWLSPGVGVDKYRCIL